MTQRETIIRCDCFDDGCDILKELEVSQINNLDTVIIESPNRKIKYIFRDFWEE